jgi:hypothetical protein
MICSGIGYYFQFRLFVDRLWLIAFPIAIAHALIINVFLLMPFIYDISIVVRGRVIGMVVMTRFACTRWQERLNGLRIVAFLLGS